MSGQFSSGTVSKDTHAMMVFESSKKSALVAYILWFFLGGFGAHRFYLGRTGSAVGLLVLFIVSILLTLVLIGAVGLLIVAIWLIVDAFLIPGIVSEYNQRLTHRIMATM